VRRRAGPTQDDSFGIVTFVSSCTNVGTSTAGAGGDELDSTFETEFAAWSVARGSSPTPPRSRARQEPEGS
jgi:hypothetical protein